MSTDSFREANSAPAVTEQETATNKLCREGALLLEGTGKGFVSGALDAVQHPQETIESGALADAIGWGISTAVEGGGWTALAAKGIGAAMLATSTVQMLNRKRLSSISTAMADNWKDGDHFNHNVDLIKNDVGRVAFDFVFSAACGSLGAGLAAPEPLSTRIQQDSRPPHLGAEFDSYWLNESADLPVAGKEVKAKVRARAINLPRKVATGANEIGNLMTRDRAVRFADLIHQTTADWKDLSQEASTVHHTKSSIDWQSMKVLHALDEAGAKVDAIDELQPEQIRNLLAHDRAGLADYDELLELRGQFDTAKAEISAVFGTRMKSLDSTFRQFTDEMGLPAARLKLSQRQPSDAFYARGNVAIRPELLYRSNVDPMIARIGSHELTHHEQNFLIFCKLADELGIGTTADNDQVAALQERMQESHALMNIDDLPPFLQARAGRRLSAATTMRAAALIDSHTKLFSLPPPNVLNAIGDNVSTLRAGISGNRKATWQRLRAPQASDFLRDVLGCEGDFSGWLKQAQLPAPDQPFTSSQRSRASQVLLGKLDSLSARIVTDLEIRDRVYYNSLHEKEAYAICQVAATHYERLAKP
ncbi:MAG TPA: hypothetical protein V6C81_31010 [Planktothrix sp.]|jgi:hypothetical protein